MSIRVSNLRLGLDEPEAVLPQHLARVLGLRADALRRWRILRKSLDARNKDVLQFVYTAEVETGEDESRVVAQARRRHRGEVRVEQHEQLAFTMPAHGAEPLEHQPVVIGSGPGGLVAAYFLAAAGYRPLVLERGRAVRDRIRDVSRFDAGGPFDPESNYLFGEGGAGTFSDGKLTCRGSGPDVRRVLELFAECKGKPSVVYDARPHLGSNRLPAVVKAIRRRIEGLGGEVRFSCRVEDLDIAAGRLRGLCTSSGYLQADLAVLAVGHSARDTYAMLLHRGVPLVPKPFQMGVRIEQPQQTVNRVQYGPARLEEKLGAADYSLVAHGPHDLFTFCMCAGGHVIPSVSEPGYFCTNGMSLSGRDSPFANSGLVVTIDPEHFPGSDPLAGVRLQQLYERRAYELSRDAYGCPIQRADDFLAGRPTPSLPPSSYPRGLVLADMAALVPPVVYEAVQHGLPILDARWQGRFLAEATLVGPEARGSAPVRIPRDDDTRQTPGIGGLYPVGEGAGYAGGIVSAAVDGLRTARAIVARFAPLSARPLIEEGPPDMPVLDREEYIEQSYFFRVFRERIAANQPTQDVLTRVHEEILSTTRLPYAIQFLATEVKHTGLLASGFSRLAHYFTPFQAFVIRQSEEDRQRFSLETALLVLERLAAYAAGAFTSPGLFVYQFETLSRNRLGYDEGLQAMSADPVYDEDWRVYLDWVRRQVGVIDFADLLYMRSELYVSDQRKHTPDYGPPVPPLFGEKEGKIAKANHGRDPLYLFAALQRQLGYPEVPRPTAPDDMGARLETLKARVREMEIRLELVESEVRGQIDLNQFMVRPDQPPRPAGDDI